MPLPAQLRRRRLCTPEEALARYVGRCADDVRDADYCVTQDTLLLDEDSGEPLVLYLAEAAAEFISPRAVALLRAVSIGTNSRMTTRGGRPLNVRNRGFGAQGRSALRNRPCRRAALDAEHPELLDLLTRFAELSDQQLGASFGPRAAEQRELVGSVRPEYRLGNSPFTSGVLNLNSRLPYHVDGGNQDRCLSAMLTVRVHSRGGLLVLPEYGLALECASGSACIFEGSQLVHGVSAMQNTKHDGARWTAVCYAFKTVWSCLARPEEVRREAARRRAFEVKVARAGRKALPRKERR